MKKICFCIFFLHILAVGYCQVNVISINNQNTGSTKEDCAFRIYGICSTENIGGVDVSFSIIDGYTCAVFKNYNSFPVTVYYRLKHDGIKHGCAPNYCIMETPSGKEGAIVLGVGSSKNIQLDKQLDCYGKNIDNSTAYSLAGIIAKKILK